MAGSVIGAQLFTLRDFLKTPADIAASMKKLRKIGYEAVQVSGVGEIDAGELRKILDGEGLVCASTHCDYAEMRDDLEKVIETQEILGCAYPAIGGLPGEYQNADGYGRFAKEASAVARKLADRGLTFGYHNHGFELQKYNGRTGLATLLEESDPEVFTFEIDTYWIQFGGGSPASWIRRVAGRAPLLHLKDMGNRGGKIIMTEVGEGNMNWPDILAAAREAGTVWYLVEQDSCERDPFESLAISLENLRALGLK